MSDFSNITNVNFDNLDELKTNNNQFKFGRTGFEFMDHHFGLRPGCIHVVHSKTSGGKTSLARSLFVNLTGSNKCLWLATEESEDDWKLKFSFSKKPIERNSFFLAEEKIKDKTTEEFLLYLEMLIEIENYKVIIFDNLTTSKFYNDKRIEDQGYLIIRIKEILKKHSATMIIIAHFNGNDPTRLFTSKDVRGSKTFPNVAEYWYNLHRLRLGVDDRGGEGKDIAILHVEKSRSHNNSDTSYQLIYEEAFGGFTKDSKISWGLAAELINKQIKVGSKK